MPKRIWVVIFLDISVKFNESWYGWIGVLVPTEHIYRNHQTKKKPPMGGSFCFGLLVI